VEVVSVRHVRRLRPLAAGTVAALVLPACLGSDAEPSLVAASPEPVERITAAPTPTASPPTTATATPVEEETADPGPPPPEPWEPGPDEVEAEAKLVAARAAEALTNYEVGGAGEAPAAVTDEPARVEALRGTAAPLLDEARWSHGRVLYAQLGGLSTERCSVMVVARQRSAEPGGEPVATTRTLDVRLRRDGGSWRFDALASNGGQPVPRPDDLPAEAEAVLDDPRISLPDSARWDVHAGTVDVRLLRVMLEIAEQTPFGVVTFTSGHPQHVFGTDRVSDHARGRAVDIAIVDDVPVVDERHEDSLTYGLVDWLRAHPEVRQVGSPWALDGYGERSFTDVVHQDHLHVAVGPEEPGVGEHEGG
jgi:hypothetical protein